MEETELSVVWSLRIRGDRISLASLIRTLVDVKGLSSDWLPCFSDLQAEHQYLSLSFYYLCYSHLRVALSNSISEMHHFT